MIYLDFVAFDDMEGPDPITDGPYESVQLTYGLLRDDNDRTIAHQEMSQLWRRQADDALYSDVVFRIEQ